MDMVEKVARAIVAVDEVATGRGSDAYYTKIAQAALAAMREPTPAMLEAFAQCPSDDYFKTIEAEGAYSWKAMIDAALSEAKG